MHTSYLNGLQNRKSEVDRKSEPRANGSLVEFLFIEIIITIRFLNYYTYQTTILILFIDINIGRFSIQTYSNNPRPVLILQIISFSELISTNGSYLQFYLEVTLIASDINSCPLVLSQSKFCGIDGATEQS